MAQNLILVFWDLTAIASYYLIGFDRHKEESRASALMALLVTASEAVFLGVISFCASSAVTGEPAIIYKAILIAAFLLVTTPISALVIARAAFLRGERMETPGALDESGKNLSEAAGR